MALIIDDDPDYRRWMAGLISGIVPVVGEAHDLDEALVKVTDLPPGTRVVLLDGNLGLDESGDAGRQLLRLMREKHPKVPVISVTNQRLGDEEAHVSKSGIFSHLAGTVNQVLNRK